MNIVIPVAGFGTRLRPLTFTKPKVLLPVAGKPIIAHILDKTLKLQVNHYSFIIGFMGDRIQDFIESRYSFKAQFIEQTELLGLGHAIWLALKELPNQEATLIILGDTIIDTDWDQILHSEYNILCTMDVEDPRRFGVVEEKGGLITGLEEKPEHPKSNKIIAGVYYIKEPQRLKEAMDKIIGNDQRTRGEYQLTDGLREMLQSGQKFRSLPLKYWYDCGKPETLLETNRELLKLSSSQEHLPSNLINPPVSIAPGCNISNSILGPYVSIGENCSIENSIIRDCIIDKGCKITNACLQDSILGEEAIFEDGFSSVILGDMSECK
ncbi:NTP transferase domain-containing protein [bacterium]|nr:NTP transferase domain-containing protein [bacterium]